MNKKFKKIYKIKIKFTMYKILTLIIWITYLKQGMKIQTMFLMIYMEDKMNFYNKNFRLLMKNLFYQNQK